jgi:HAD superfamily hydrolase (TIGR01509 family)
LIIVPEHIRGLIFDCDGTLVDSMPSHLEAWKEAIESFGGTYDAEFFFSKKGMRDADIVGKFNRHYGTALDSARVVRVKDELFMQRINDVRPLSPVVDVVRRYHSLLPMAVASGGGKEIVERELQVVGIGHLFDAILTANDPFKPKPSPDLFLEAARKIGVQPSLCQAFEDGDIGLQAAKSAGMLATDIRLFMQE